MSGSVARIVRVKTTSAGIVIDAAVEASQLGEAVSNLPRKSRAHFGVLALPGAHTFTRMIHVEESEFSNLERVVALEAQRHLPLSIDKMSYDWAVVSSTEGRRDIQVAAVESGIVSQYDEELRKHKITPVAVEPESIALTRALLTEQQVQKGNFVIADLREDRLLIVLVHFGGVHGSFYHKDWGWGSFVERLHKTTSESPDDLYKKIVAEGMGAGHGKHAKAFVTEFQHLTELLRQSLEYFNDQYHEKPKLLVSGYLRQFGNVAEQLEQSLNHSCQLQSSAHLAKKDSQDAKKLEDEPKWDVALGEALYKINV